MKDLLVGVLCKKVDPDRYSVIKDKLAFDLILFTPRGINWKQRTISGLLLSKGRVQKKKVPFPRVVFNQFFTRSSATARGLEREIGRGKVFNIRTRINKMTTYSILSQSSLKPMVIPTRQFSAEAMLEMLSTGPVIFKPVYGAKGRDVLKIVREGERFKVSYQVDTEKVAFSRADDLLKWLEKYTDKEDFILQPFISFTKLDGHVFDLRVLVQKDRLGKWHVTATMSRVGFGYSYISNCLWKLMTAEQVLERLSSPVTLSQLSSNAIEVAMNMERAIAPLGELGIDYGIAGDKLWIIEVNGMPSKQIFEKFSAQTMENVMLTPLMYARFLARNSKKSEKLSTNIRYLPKQ